MLLSPIPVQVKMGKQTKTKKPEKVGKGKITPAQIAFIVDQYLLDNDYKQTHSTFTSEASDLFSKFRVQAHKGLLSLGAMLDEYICLKEQKVTMDHEKSCLEKEKFRVQTLLKGMQDAMNAYNSGGSVIVSQPMVSSSMFKSAIVGSQDHRITTNGTPTGFPTYNTPAVLSSNTTTDPKSFTTPVTAKPNSRRRKSSTDASNAPLAAKKPRITSPTINTQPQVTDTLLQPINSSKNQETVQDSPVQGSNIVKCLFNQPAISPLSNIQDSPVEGSNIAKCLFNQPTISPHSNSSGPNTPPIATTSQTEKTLSPLENSIASTSYNNITPQHMTSTNRTVITSETIRVSPTKQVSYYSIERNHCISSSSSPIKANIGRQTKRDHVKGRLNFDGSDDVVIKSGEQISCQVSPSESEKEVDIFDLDLPNLDGFGDDFSLSEFLLDFDFDGAEMGYCTQPATDSSPETLSGSPNTLLDADIHTNQIMSELSSTMTQVFTEKDMNIPGQDSVTSSKSTLNCVKIFSPVKNQRSSMDQENLYAPN